MGALITARAESSAVHTDLATGDYATGTSVTNALQSETPDAPTGLVAVALSRAIEFTWSLGTFWEQNGISELWEYTASTPFSSATRIWTGRGSRVVIQKEDSTVRYYWVRIRTVGDETSDTEPATNGLAASALRDPNIIADPNFELATDDTYWVKSSSYSSLVTPTGVAIVPSGGVYGGVLQFTGNSTLKFVWNKRSTPFPIITGQSVRVRFRWRRTSTITSANTTDGALIVGMSTTAGDIPPSADVPSGGLTLTRADVNAVTANQWQESEFVATASNAPKSTTQLPFIEILINQSADITGGVIEVDQVQAHLN